ncbi:hypothetical protein QN277_022808 [Acacia crassicarpa]|uniref:Uncharacterized protein n=1 Tax=Acacia crassicarpa TaxID=499986 RepID=A0AAE1JFQ6_9FABA|nr:hypothetical protein QN277_022808 [Acacia crassicarpa]
MVSSYALALALTLALADVTKANNTLDSTTTDIEKIQEIFADLGVFSFFNNPTIETEKKKKVLLPCPCCLLSHRRYSTKIFSLASLLLHLQFEFATLGSPPLRILSSFSVDHRISSSRLTVSLFFLLVGVV